MRFFDRRNGDVSVAYRNDNGYNKNTRALTSHAAHLTRRSRRTGDGGRADLRSGRGAATAEVVCHAARATMGARALATFWTVDLSDATHARKRGSETFDRIPLPLSVKTDRARSSRTGPGRQSFRDSRPIRPLCHRRRPPALVRVATTYVRRVIYAVEKDAAVAGRIDDDDSERNTKLL